MRPKREHATNYGQTYMVTAATWGRRALFRTDPWVRLFIDTLYHHRGSAYLLHAFVVMPDHFHALITPSGSLEKAVQFIKGGFSYRVKKELGSNMEVWQKGFSDHRIRDAADFARHVAYIDGNPVRKHLCESAEQYSYSSAHAGFEVDEVPRGLKPPDLVNPHGAPEGAPFQNKSVAGPEGAPFQNKSVARADGAAFQDATHGAAKHAPFQTPIKKTTSQIA